MMRTVLFWTHVISAFTAGIVIVIMSATGTLLMYEKQMTRWADGYVVTPPTETTRVSIESLLQKAAAEKPASTASAITILADPTAAATVSFGRETSLFLNPYTGAVLGEGSKSARAFFRSVTNWHRWLALEGESRATARAVTGASNLLFLFIVVTGIVIWWPKAWTPAAIKNIVLFRGGMSGKARHFNWHNVIGFWSFLPLFVVVLSGVVISYPWAGDLVYRLTGSEPPPRQTAPTAGGPQGQRPEGGARPPRETESRPAMAPLDSAGLDALLAKAAAKEPAWRTINARLPQSAESPVVFSIDASDGAARPDKRSTLTLDRATGEETKYETYASQNGGRRARTWLRFLHTGEALGLPGQTIAGVASAGVLVLAWTGLMLSWVRFRAWRKRRARATDSEVALVNTTGASA